MLDWKLTGLLKLVPVWVLIAALTSWFPPSFIHSTVSPTFIFKTRTMTVTLKTKDQLKKWLDMYPAGEYTLATDI